MRPSSLMSIMTTENVPVPPTHPSPLRTRSLPQCLTAGDNGLLFAGHFDGVEALNVFSSDFQSSFIPLSDGVRALVLPQGIQTGAVAAQGIGNVISLDIPSSKVVATFKTAADRSPTALCGFNDLQTGFVGDEAGGVLSVDLRVRRPIAHAFQHGDYISALSKFPNGNVLLAASGDGALGVYDTRSSTLPLAAISDGFDDDLCTLAVDHVSARAVAGTLQGALHLYDVQQLGRLARSGEDTSETVDVKRFRGHPDSVNAIELIGDVAVTGCADGLVRVIDPTCGKLLALLQFDRSWAHVIGDEKEENETDVGRSGKKKKRKRDIRWPIEAMAVVRSGADRADVLALAGHEKCVRFADLSVLADSDVDEEAEKEVEKEDTPPPSPPRRKMRGKKKRGQNFTRERRNDGFFGDL